MLATVNVGFQLLLDAEGGLAPLGMQVHHATVHTVALPPDGSRIVTASMDDSVPLWPLPPTDRLAERLYTPTSPCAAAADRVY